MLRGAVRGRLDGNRGTAIFSGLNLEPRNLAKSVTVEEATRS
jgi:hypothetical protein